MLMAVVLRFVCRSAAYAVLAGNWLEEPVLSRTA